MNRLVVKQKEKEEEEEKQGKKKKKKEKVIKITKAIIKRRLLKHFQNHIGEEAKTSQEEIFQNVLGINPYMVDSFMRFYFWKSIEEVIRKLRRTDVCFIMKKKGHYFVLKDITEANYFKRICDKAIDGMGKAKDRAEDWVENEKWKKFKDEVYDEDDEENDEEEIKEKKSPDEIIDDKVDNSRRKANKIWTGENEN